MFNTDRAAVGPRFATPQVSIPPRPIRDTVDIEEVNLENAFPSLDVITRRILKAMQDTIEKAAAETAQEDAAREAIIRQERTAPPAPAAESEGPSPAEEQRAQQVQADQAEHAAELQQAAAQAAQDIEGSNAGQEVARAYGVSDTAPAPGRPAPAPVQPAQTPAAAVAPPPQAPAPQVDRQAAAAAVAAVQKALAKTTTAEAATVHRFKVDVRPTAPAAPAASSAAPTQAAE